ncbi:hypothetical protein LRH25_10190 [Ideonella azotifigens]|nr:hypothetical protein [Ideonella azotifigens]MCD2340713.1 hypothetical protein [Ideonella azotifigens]
MLITQCDLRGSQLKETTVNFRKRQWLVTLLELTGVALGTSAYAQTRYEALDFEPQGVSFIQLGGLNDKGWIASSGAAGGDGHTAYLTGPNGRNNHPIGGDPVQSVNAVNNRGMIAGSSTRGRPFVTGIQGEGRTDLGIPVDAEYGHAYSINAKGQVVGDYQSAAGTKSFLYDPQGGLVTLNVLNINNHQAMAINKAGVIVGSYANPDWLPYVAKPPEYKAKSLLNKKLAVSYAQATAINDANTVVGAFRDSLGMPGAFISRDGSPMQDLGAPAGLYITPMSINDSDLIVGWYSYTYGPTMNAHAFACQSTCSNLIELTDLVELPDNIVLNQAISVNSSGQILATASNGRAYLLTPLKQK